MSTPSGRRASDWPACPNDRTRFDPVPEGSACARRPRCACAPALGTSHRGQKRARHALEVYFKDPFLAYAYIGSIPFFVALHQAFKLLGYVGQDTVFSPAAVRALRTIRYCAMAIVGFVAVGEIFIMLGDSDDRAGGVFMGILIICPSIVIAAAMVVLERVLQNAVNIKSEKGYRASSQQCGAVASSRVSEGLRQAGLPE